METLDIALAHPELIFPRGAEKQLSKLCYHLSKAGHEVTLYTFEKADPYMFDPLLQGCRTVSLGKRWKTHNLFVDYPRWYRLCKELAGRMGKHDVLNCHNFPSSWITNFTAIPSVWMCNEPPARYSWSAPLSSENALKKLLYPPFSLLDSHMTRRISRIACLDSMMKRIITRAYPKIPVDAIGSAAELDRPVRHVENGRKDLLLVAALDPHK